MKKLNKDAATKLLFKSDWLVENTVHYSELTICPMAQLYAPEGKYVSLIVNGIGQELKPGTYRGDVVLAVSEHYHMPPHALMMQNDISIDMEATVVVDNQGTQVRVPELITGGTFTNHSAENFYMGTTAPSYNGILVTEDAEYTVKNAQLDFEGFGANDFMGEGAGIEAIDNAKVTIEDSEFHFSGVTRCAVHAGGRSEVTVNRCTINNFSPDTDWIGDFSWAIALTGTNRLCQLADGAKATYNDCTLTSNGWGITSIDGTSEPVALRLNRCKLRLIGPRSHGYGAFCIGDNEVTMRDCDVRVNGYPMLVMGMKNQGRPSILGSKISGRRFGAMVYSDTGSIFEIKDSDFNTGKSTLVVKGSNTVINVENTTMHPGNGTLLQLMDSDECGMNAINYVVPVGEMDVYKEGRELSAADPQNDVFLNLKDCTLTGNIFNSTTNILAHKRVSEGSRGLFHDTLIGLGGMDDAAPQKPGMPPMPPAPEGPDGLPAPEVNPMFKDNRTPKNLELNLTNTRITGVISSALQFYREGVTEITYKNRMELSNVTQTASPTVNNGVILSLDGSSSWTVTDTSYITALTLAPGAAVSAPAGKALTMTVDGAATPIAPGTYTGKIVLTLN